MAELPHGRGLRRYAGSSIDQSESWESRGRGVSEAREWTYPPLPFGLESSPTLVTMEQSVVFSHLPMLTEATELSFARSRVTTAQSGQVVEAAIYRAETREGTRRLLRVPRSAVVFEAASTGIKTVELSGVLRLEPGVRYLMSVRSSHASVAMPGVNAGSANLIPTYTIPGSTAGTFPGEVQFNDLTAAYDVKFPWILYISRELRELI